MKKFHAYELDRGEVELRKMGQKAQAVVDTTDDCGIAAREEYNARDEKKLCVYVFGGWEAEGTPEEVERALEEIYNEYFNEEEENE